MYIVLLTHSYTQTTYVHKLCTYVYVHVLHLANIYDKVIQLRKYTIIL